MRAAILVCAGLLGAACSTSESPEAAPDATMTPDVGDVSTGADVSAAPSPVIDIYVLAGPGETHGTDKIQGECTTSEDCGAAAGCDTSQMPPRCVVPADAWKTACNRDDAASCSLYRVGVELHSGAIQSVELVMEPNGTMMFPSISPDNQRVAFELRTTRGVGQIMACELDTLACGGLSIGTEGDRGRYASWLADDELLFGLKAAGGSSGWADVYRVGVELDGAPSPVGSAAIVLGDASTGQYAFQDPWAFVRSGQRFVASHGTYPTAPPCRGPNGETGLPRSQCAFHPSSVPNVWNLDTGVGFPVSLEMTGIENPWSCAHVAVSPDGQRLVCTVQETYADHANMASQHVYGDPHNVPIETSDGVVKQYFAVEFSLDEAAGAYVSTTGGEMFSHKGPAALEEIEPRFDQSACSSLTHAIYLHKYTEYCADSEHIVTTVSCRGPSTLGDAGDAPNRVVHAAAYLIDVTDRERPVYTNLTSAIETWLSERGEAPATLMAASLTCAGPVAP